MKKKKENLVFFIQQKRKNDHKHVRCSVDILLRRNENK